MGMSEINDAAEGLKVCLHKC